MENERFTITDDLKAKWAVDQIRKKKEDLSELKRWYKTQYASAEARTTSEIGYLEGLLFEYFQQVPRRKTKTGIEKYKFPGGELVLTPARVTYKRDDTALTAWLEQHRPDLIKVTKSPMWNEIKKAILDTGELPEGVIPEETAEKFEVKISEEKDGEP